MNLCNELSVTFWFLTHLTTLSLLSPLNRGQCPSHDCSELPAAIEKTIESRKPGVRTRATWFFFFGDSTFKAPQALLRRWSESSRAAMMSFSSSGFVRDQRVNGSGIPNRFSWMTVAAGRGSRVEEKGKGA
jgi:hypothetical protein